MFYVKAVIPTTVTTGRLFWKKTRLIDKEDVGTILRDAVLSIEHHGKKIGWHRSVVRRVQETVLTGLAVRVNKWFEAKPNGDHEPMRLIVVAAISQYEEETPSFFVGDETSEDYKEFCEMCEKQRMAEIRRRLEDLGLMAVSKADVTVNTPEGTYMGTIDYNTARHLHKELGYGCEVSYKEVNP